MIAMVSVNDYSRALFELAREEGADTAILEETAAVRKLFQENPEYMSLLDTPSLPMEQRLGLLDESLSDLHVYHLNFLKILCEKHGIRQYTACAEGYEKLYDEAHGILRATAITATQMSAAQMTALRGKLEKMTGKTVNLTNVKDPKVLGGVTLRFEGQQLDSSLQSRLDELRSRLTESIV